MIKLKPHFTHRISVVVCSLIFTWSPLMTMAQDLLILKSGEEIEAKVTEVHNDKVKYKRWDNLQGPTFVTGKEKLFLIKYENGSKEVIGASETPQTPTPATTSNQNTNSQYVTNSSNISNSSDMVVRNKPSSNSFSTNQKSIPRKPLKFNVSFGSPFDRQNVYGKGVMLGEQQHLQHNGKIFTYSYLWKGKRDVLTIFDANTGNHLGSKEYKREKRVPFVQHCVRMKGDKFYYLFQGGDTKKWTFLSRELDTQSESVMSFKTLFTTSRPVAFGPAKWAGLIPNPGEMINNGPNWYYSLSNDKSKFAVRYRLRPESRKDVINKDVLGFYVFDENMNKVWGGEFEMPYTEADMDNLGFTVMNDGTVQFLVHVKQGRKSFELFTFSEKGMKRTPINVQGNMTFNTIHLKEDLQGNIVAVGYYATGVEVTYGWGKGLQFNFNIDGIYTFKLDKYGNAIHSKKHEFSLDFITQNRSNREIEKAQKREAMNKGGIPNLWIRSVDVQDDGSFIVIGERVYISYEWVKTGDQQVCHFDNIVVSKILPNGEIAWLKKLPKNQRMWTLPRNLTSRANLSYKYLRNGDNHIFFYEDNPENLNIGNYELPKRVEHYGKKEMMCAYRVYDDNGDFERIPIYTKSDLNGTKVKGIQISNAFTVNGNAVMETASLGKKQFAFLKIVVND